MPIHCSIVSQDRLVWEGEADIIIAPGVEGEMGILPHHAPLLSTLQYGYLKVRYEGQEDVFTIAGGIIEVQPNLVTVLADAAENVKEIDIARAEAARQRAEGLLHTHPEVSDDSYMAIEFALRRSKLRLDAVQKYRRAGGTRPHRQDTGSHETG